MTATTRTLAQIITQSRVLLQDVLPTPEYRYTDAELVDCINDAMIETRRVRPDLFLTFGLRSALPLYTIADLGNPTAMPPVPSTAFPLDEQYFSGFIWYVVGRAELREDTFTDNGRAVTLLNKFTSQLLQVAS